MVELQTTWGWLIATYLFLGGLSAGVFCTTALIHLVACGRFEKTVVYGVWTAVICLAVGLGALLLEVKQPFRAIVLFESFVNASSWMAVGAWLLFTAFIVFLLAAVFLTRSLGGRIITSDEVRGTVSRILIIIGIPLAVAVAVYTGILLGAAPGVPLWNTWLLPALFTVSAFDTGVAVSIIESFFVEKDEGFAVVRKRLEQVTIGLVAIESIVLVIYLVTMSDGTLTTQTSVQLLMNGPLAPAFWVLVACVGLACPLVIALAQLLISRDHSIPSLRKLGIGGSACALVGGYSLRFIILAAGIHTMLISPVVQQMADNVYFFF